MIVPQVLLGLCLHELGVEGTYKPDNAVVCLSACCSFLIPPYSSQKHFPLVRVS